MRSWWDILQYTESVLEWPVSSSSSASWPWISTTVKAVEPTFTMGESSQGSFLLSLNSEQHSKASSTRHTLWLLFLYLKLLTVILEKVEITLFTTQWTRNRIPVCDTWCHNEKCSGDKSLFLIPRPSPRSFPPCNKRVWQNQRANIESVELWEEAVSSHLISSPPFEVNRIMDWYTYLLRGLLSFLEYHLNTFPVLFFFSPLQLLVL